MDVDELDFDELIRFQRTMASNIVRENEVDRKIKLISLLNSMHHGKVKRIAVESVILEAGMEGMSEHEVMRLIEKLKDDRIIKESEPGFIRMV